MRPIPCRVVHFYAVCILVLAALSVNCAAQHIIHGFTGGGDGANPTPGVTVDRGGNLYGTTINGGDTNCEQEGCGVVYKLTQRNSNWTLSTLYMFHGGADGAGPGARVVFGPDGALYGTTIGGALGFGTIFRLQPPAHACESVSCPWSETILYTFQAGLDGAKPVGDLIFDHAGNIYGVTLTGGSNGLCDGFGCGTVYELSPSNGQWQETVLYRFEGVTDGASPYGGLVFDAAGNLYGVAEWGGSVGGGDCSNVPYLSGCGVVYELTPSNGGWTQSVVYTFSGGSDGGVPTGSLLLADSGVMYGTTEWGGAGFYTAGNGTVFQLTPSNGGWAFSSIYAFTGPGLQGPVGGVTADADGNLFGARANGPPQQPPCFGALFKLSHDVGWNYNMLYCFDGGFEGGFPSSEVTFDASGNLFGTAGLGQYGEGVVWEFP